MTIAIHSVFRPIQPDDHDVVDRVILEGDCMEAIFQTGDVIPFHFGPLFHHVRTPQYYEGLVYDHHGNFFPWQQVTR